MKYCTKLAFILGLIVSCNRAPKLSDGRRVICSKNIYNCPDRYDTSNPKQLKSCEDVKLVWDYCKGDPHFLDRDTDNKPCETSCMKVFHNEP